MKTNNSKLDPARFPLLFLFCFVLSILSFFSACVKEEEGPSLQGDTYGINDIAGSWTATEAFFSSLETPYKGSVDVIGEGGSLTLKIETSGRFKITIVLPGEANQVINGKLGFDEEWLAVSYDDDPEEYEYHFFELNDNKTILTIRGNGTYDFDDDGVEDLSSMSFVLSRN